MTKWMLEIATSPNQKSVGLLAMTDLDSYFHCYLVLMGRMRIFPGNKGISEKETNKKGKGTPPLIPPQWGNEFNNSPPWRGAALRRGGCL
jgi:hypothetical protein